MYTSPLVIGASALGGGHVYGTSDAKAPANLSGVGCCFAIVLSVALNSIPRIGVKFPWNFVTKPPIDAWFCTTLRHVTSAVAVAVCVGLVELLAAGQPPTTTKVGSVQTNPYVASGTVAVVMDA